MEFVIDAQKRLQNLQGMQYKFQDNGQILCPYSSIDPNCPTLQETDYSDEEPTSPKYRNEMDLKNSFKKTEQEQGEDEYYHLLTHRRHGNPFFNKIFAAGQYKFYFYINKCL